jgi:hypothetical protein
MKLPIIIIALVSLLAVNGCKMKKNGTESVPAINSANISVDNSVRKDPQAEQPKHEVDSQKIKLDYIKCDRCQYVEGNSGDYYVILDGEYTPAGIDSLDYTIKKIVVENKKYRSGLGSLTDFSGDSLPLSKHSWITISCNDSIDGVKTQGRYLDRI